MSLRESEWVSEWTNECSRAREGSKQCGANEWVSGAGEWTSEWPIIYTLIPGCSKPQCPPPPCPLSLPYIFPHSILKPLGPCSISPTPGGKFWMWQSLFCPMAKPHVDSFSWDTRLFYGFLFSNFRSEYHLKTSLKKKGQRNKIKSCFFWNKSSLWSKVMEQKRIPFLTEDKILCVRHSCSKAWKEPVSEKATERNPHLSVFSDSDLFIFISSRISLLNSPPCFSFIWNFFLPSIFSSSFFLSNFLNFFLSFFHSSFLFNVFSYAMLLGLRSRIDPIFGKKEKKNKRKKDSEKRKGKSLGNWHSDSIVTVDVIGYCPSLFVILSFFPVVRIRSVIFVIFVVIFVVVIVFILVVVLIRDGYLRHICQLHGQDHHRCCCRHLRRRCFWHRWRHPRWAETSSGI